MSAADDDDLEEEELLQKALREQAQRDINYQRIAQNRIARRGAASAHPPPPPVPTLKKAPQHHNQQRPRSSQSQNHQHGNASSYHQQRPAAPSKPKAKPKEEEVLDVDMLDLSSDDDDLPPPKASASGRGSQYSSRTWESDEPDCWKRVNEAELARRVRELRDAKVVPTIGRADKAGKVPSATTPVASSAARTRNEHLDPLGLGVIDLKSLTLKRDSGESAPPQDIPHDPTLRDKVIYLSEKFDAKYYLSRIHQNSSVAELEHGASALKTDLHDRTQQRKQLVKENFDCFVSCKTTIDDIQVKLKEIEEDPEGPGTTRLRNAIQEVDDLANHAFGTIFERQVQAEKIKSVQGILQRFRTLFNLPSTIRRNINKGDYDLAVREYRKAKSLVLPSHVGILKKVMEEVDKVVLEFKNMLYKSVEDPQIEQANLEHTIMLLLELEPESDPVWHYLNVQNGRIRDLLENCTIDYDVRMDALRSLQRDRMLSDVRWKQIQQESSKNCTIDYSILLGDYASQMKETPSQEADALRGRLIYMLTAVVAHHVPLFWKLALSIFSGKFAKLSQIGSANGYADPGKQSEGKNKQSPPEARLAEMKHTNHSLEEVAGMVQDIINVYESKVQHAFQEFDESNIHHPYMREAIKEISKAYSTFSGKDSAPKGAVRKLFALRAEVMKLFVSRLCSWMKTATLDMINDENWVPVSFLERHRSSFTISGLPLAFHDNLTCAMDQIHELVENLKNDSYKPQDVLAQVQEMQDTVKFTFFNCFLDFTGALEKLSHDISQNMLKKDASENGITKVQGGKFTGLQPSEKITNPHQKVLMILSNIGYCKADLTPRFVNKYKLIWVDLSDDSNEEESYKEMEAEVSDVVAALTDSEEKVLARYVNMKASMLSTVSEMYIAEDGFNWGAAPAVQGLRDAAIDLLYPLVAVHAEVYSGARPYLEKAISVLVEGLFDTLLGMFNEDKKYVRYLDRNGYCQLMLELEYFEAVLNTYLTQGSQDAFKSIRENLLEICLDTINIPENTGISRRPNRSNEEGSAMDDRQQEAIASPDSLIELSHKVSSNLLPLELKRTQVNIICFGDVSAHLESSSDSGKLGFQPFNGITSSLNSQMKGAPATGGAVYSFHRRKLSGSSLSDSDSGKHFAVVYPYSPRHQLGYASSDVGSETGSSDIRGRGPGNDRFSKTYSDVRWNARRMAKVNDDDLR